MTLEARFWQKVVKTDGCWEWTPKPLSHGYGGIGAGGRHGETLLAHRVSWEIHYGPIPDGLIVLHRCDNKICVRPDHLATGTHADNARDKVEKGRHRNGTSWRKGADVPTAKLTEDQVRDIKRRIHSERGIDLAAEYGVSKVCISMIKTGRTWASVTP